MSNNRSRIGILLVWLILVLAAYVVVFWVEDKTITVSDIIAVVGILIAILIQYRQNEQALREQEQARKDARFDAKMDSVEDYVIRNIFESHNLNSKNMNK